MKRRAQMRIQARRRRAPPNQSMTDYWTSLPTDDRRDVQIFSCAPRASQRLLRDLEVYLEENGIVRSAMQKEIHRHMIAAVEALEAAEDDGMPPLEEIPEKVAPGASVGRVGFTARLMCQVDLALSALVVLPSMRDRFRRIFRAVGLFVENEGRPYADVLVRKIEPLQRSIDATGMRRRFADDMTDAVMHRHIGDIWRHLCAALEVFGSVEVHTVKIVSVDGCLQDTTRGNSTVEFHGRGAQYVPRDGYAEFVMRRIARESVESAADEKSTPLLAQFVEPSPPVRVPRWRRAAKYLGHWLCCVPPTTK
jgi:hypothetical protein